LQGRFRRITLQLGKIEMKIIFLILLFNFIIHLLTDNSFVPYRLSDFWYEMQKKAKKFTKERELLGWKKVAVWKDFRHPYISEVMWVECIQHVTSDHFIRRSHSNVENQNRCVHSFVTTHNGDSIRSFRMRSRW